MSLPSYDVFKASLAAIAGAPEATVKSLYDAISAANTPAATTPATTAPATSTPAATSYPFNVTVLAISGKTLTIKTNALVVKDKVLMRLTDGPAINVVGVAVDPKNSAQSIITADQDMTWAVNNSVNKAASVEDRYPAATTTPATSTPTTTTPVSTAPATSTPVASTTTLAMDFNNFTGGDWKNGVYLTGGKAGISLAFSNDVVASCIAGAELTFSNNTKRTISWAQPLDGMVNVWFDGDAIDPALGYPNKVSVLKKTAVTVTTPTQAAVNDAVFGPIVIKQGYTGQIFVNLGMGQGGDEGQSQDGTWGLPGKAGSNYAFPTEAEIVRAVGLGFKRFRVGFLWERAIKPGFKSETYRGKDAAGNNYTLDEMIRVGKLCKKYGATVKWDMHNYGGYSATGTSKDRKQVGASGGPTVDVYANDWKAIITALKSDADCWAATYGFDTMNEWQSITYAVVKAAGQKVLDVCATLAEKKVFVFEGINYSSCINWVANNPDYHTLKHPLGKDYIEFSAHLYLDQGADGFYEEGDTISSAEAKAGATFQNLGYLRIKAFAQWCKDNGVKGNIGENMVTGTMTNLLVAEMGLLKFCVQSGIDVYAFGMSDWFGSNPHNIELEINKPALACYQAAMKIAA